MDCVHCAFQTGTTTHTTLKYTLVKKLIERVFGFSCCETTSQFQTQMSNNNELFVIFDNILRKL